MKSVENAGNLLHVSDLDCLASPIRRIPGRGFADFTVTRRFPKIAATALAALAGRQEARRAIDALINGVIAGTQIDMGAFARPTAFWSRYIDNLAGAMWADLPFFDVEFVFYHALNSIAGYFSGGTDVFKQTRSDALAAALAAIAPASAAKAKSSERDRLADALWFALLGNETDYSQLATGHGQLSKWSEVLVVDNCSVLLDAISSPANASTPIHIIADNAGPELVADLMLVDTLLSRSEEECVVLHCKPWPMFVSDALVDDVQGSIDAMRSHASGFLCGLGKRLHTALTAERLRLEQHASWGEPRHFDGLDADLVSALRKARVIIAKGDLNYRRFIGDRDWPMETPVLRATRGVSFTAFALRILKSDALVGVRGDVTARAMTRSPEWRTDGSHALIQRLGALGDA